MTQSDNLPSPKAKKIVSSSNLSESKKNIVSDLNELEISQQNTDSGMYPFTNSIKELEVTAANFSCVEDDKTAHKSVNYKWLLLILFVSSVIDYMSYGVIVPILPFFAKTFDAKPLVIGLLLGSYDFMNIFAPSFWGSWSERIGRRPAMLINIMGTATAFLVFGFANSLLMLFLGRILSGMAGSSIVIGQSYIAKYATQETRTRDLGILAASAVFGMVLGASLTSLLVGSNPNEINYNVPGLIASGISLLTFCSAFILLPKEAKTTSSTLAQEKNSWFLSSIVPDIIDLVKTPAINRLLLLVVIVYMAQAGSQTVLPLWFDYRFHWGPQQYSYMLILCALLIGGTQAGLLGLLSRWFSESYLVILGISSMAVGAILIPFVGSLPVLLVAIAMATVGQGINNPSLTSLLIDQTDMAIHSRLLGMAQSLGSLGSFIGAVSGGLVFGVLGPEFPYWISGGILLIALFANQQFISQSVRALKLPSTGMNNRDTDASCFGRDGAIAPSGEQHTLPDSFSE